jgi:hypothetical protein
MVVSLELSNQLPEWPRNVLYTAALLFMPFQKVLRDPGVKFILVNF